MSRYDDDIWRLVPVEPGPTPPHLQNFVRGLGEVVSALDLGCGDGRLTTELRAQELTVADVSEVALERARARLSAAAAGHLAPGHLTPGHLAPVHLAPVHLTPVHLTPVHLTPDEPLPLADGSFDLVLCAETIEHVRDVQLLLSEVRRVLRPRGRLALTTPAHGRLTGLDVLLRGFERHFDPLSPHLRFLTARSLSQLLDTMGFDPGTVRRQAGTLMTVATR